MKTSSKRENITKENVTSAKRINSNNICTSMLNSFNQAIAGTLMAAHTHTQAF